jgi:glycosyltransferase involved in cell wall biosynthesis
VGDHTANLVREFEKMGARVFVFTGTQNALGENVFTAFEGFGAQMENQLKDLIEREKINRILWQYVPYSYQEKGLPFWWPSLMRRIYRPELAQSIFFHEVSLRFWGYGFKQMMAAAGQRMIANRAASMAKAIFSSIPLYSKYFWFNKPIVVPISANIFLPTVDKQQATDPYIFCFANRADIALLEAIKMLKDKHQLKLILGGNISEGGKKKIENQVQNLGLKEQVYFTGQLPQEKLAAIIRDSTIFMQPQIVERNNQGGVSAKNGTIMAAMAMGKAIISCRGDMTDERLFREEENMVFVKYGDAEGYREALERLMKDENLRASLGQNARNTYEKYASWEVTAGMIGREMGLKGLVIGD